jgi:ankyrin repeat protein
VTGGDLVAVRALIARGADVNAPNQQGRTLLTEVLNQRSMMSQGLDPHTLDPYAELLLVAGARATGDDLCCAIRPRGSNPRLIEKLIRAGADVRWAYGDGSTPLYHAAYFNDRPTAALLLEHGADIQAPRRIGFTPLQVAAENDATDVAELLIARGAQLEAREGSEGDTPLHVAAHCDAPRVAALLIARGANVGAVNNAGKTPLDLANERGNSKIAEMLSTTGVPARNPADGAR